MSTRCKACDKSFTESEMLAKNPITKEPEDLCSGCKAAVKAFQGPSETERFLEDFEETMEEKIEKVQASFSQGHEFLGED